MRYIHTWVDQGLISKYLGQANLEDLQAAQFARNKDPRIEQIKFIIVDTRNADADSVNLFEAHILGRNDAKIWTRNPNIHLLLVSPSDVVLSLMEAYNSYTQVLCCPWKVTIHKDFTEAVELVNRLYGAKIDLSTTPPSATSNAHPRG